MKNKISLFIIMLLLKSFTSAFAQPPCDSWPNIDFELGNLSAWGTGIGTCCPITITGPGPAPLRHTITSGTGTDLWGGFPIKSPVSGNNYSLKLGNDAAGSQAESATYLIYVPPGPSLYRIAFRYAVVLQDPILAHSSGEKPRFEVKAISLSSGLPLPCGEFSYVAGSLSGFTLSLLTPPPSPPSTTWATDPVYYKDWSTGSISLAGLGGSFVAIEFTTGDCALGGHFGYAYIDMQCGLFADNIRACCPGTTNLSGPDGFASYYWYKASDMSTLIGSGKDISVPTICTTTTYAVVCVPPPGCGLPEVFYVNVIPSVTPVAGSIVGDNPVCEGTTHTYANPSGTSGGTWSSSNTGLAPINASSGTVTFGSVSGSTTVTLTYTTPPNDPCPSVSTTMVVVVNPAPVFTPTVNPNPLCVGQSYTLSVTGITDCPGCTFSWVSLGVFISGSMTTPRPPITDIFGASVPYDLTLTNSYGCSTTMFLVVDADPNPNASFTVPTPLCAGDVVTATFPPGGTPGGTWSCSPGWPVASVSGGVLTCGPVTYPTSVTITHTVTTTNCGTDVKTQTITINPLPAFTPTVTAGPHCSGVPFTLSAIVTGGCPGGCSYLWTVGSATFPGTTLTRTEFELWGMTYIYNLKLTNSYGCSLTQSIGVDVNPQPEAGTIVGPTSGCNDMSYVFHVTGNNGVGTWSLSGGMGIITINPVTGGLTVTGTVTAPITVIISYTVGVGWLCGPISVTSHTFTLYPVPVVAPFVTPTVVCSGVPYSLHSGVLPLACPTCIYTYDWTRLGILTSTLSDPLPQPPVFDDWGISIPYTLEVRNQWGCKGYGQIVVDVHPQPRAGTIIGATEGCKDMSYVFNITGNNGPGTWSLSGGMGIITIDPVTGVFMVTGAVTVPITVTISYTVTNICGTDVATHVFTLHPMPVIAPFVVPNPSCSGQPYTLHSGVSSGCGTCTYTWVGLGGSTTMTDPLVMPPVFDPWGIMLPYTVTVVNSGGCSVTGHVLVDITPPSEACITVGFDPILSDYFFTITGTSGATVSYEFYSCGGILLGSGSGLLVGSLVYASGTAVTFPPGTCLMCVTSVSNMGCTWPVECCARINIGGGGKSAIAYNNRRHNEKTMSAISIVPNPNKGVFTISGSMESIAGETRVTVEITDVLGKVVFSDIAPIENGKINKKVAIADNIANGVYLLRIKNDASGQVIRFTLDR